MELLKLRRFFCGSVYNSDQTGFIARIYLQNGSVYVIFRIIKIFRRSTKFQLSIMLGAIYPFLSQPCFFFPVFSTSLLKTL